MRLAEIMEQTHTRQSDLADYLGMSRAAVSQYISGKREPDIATLTRIAKLWNYCGTRKFSGITAFLR